MLIELNDTALTIRTVPYPPILGSAEVKVSQLWEI